MHLIYCPNCTGMIEIESINCMIFRHAIYRTGDPYDPHATVDKIDSDRDLIIGCGIQFRYDGINPPVIICAPNTI